MKKALRFLSVWILTAAVSLGSLNIVFAAGASADYSREIKILSDLNIIEGYSAESYVTQQSITYKAFLTSLINMRERTKADTDIVVAARSYGILKEDETVNLSSAIVLEDAVKFAVRLLGFESYIELTGKGYMAAGANFGFLDGIAGDGNPKLDSDKMLQLLYNMLDIGVFGAELSNYNEFKQSEETIIEQYRGIKKAKGMITANEFTGLYDPDEGRHGKIAIDDILYLTENSTLNDYLGMSVEFYYTDTDDLSVLTAAPLKNGNDELVVDADRYVGVNKGITQIEYKKNKDKPQTSTYKLSSTLKVIYNGKAYPGYTKDIFDIGEGSIRLLDYDSDKKADVAFITDYELIKVSTCNPSKQIIFNEYDNIDGAVKIDFGDLEPGRDIFVYRNGAESDFKSVQANDIILMERSASGSDRYVKLWIRSEKISGMPTSAEASEDGFSVTIDETQYYLNADFERLLNSKKLDISEISLGRQYTFYMDINGKIAGIEADGQAEGELYVLVYSVLRNLEEDKVYVRYVDENDEHRKTAFADKTYFDGKSIQGADDLFTKAESLKGEIIRIYVNADGEIRKVTTAELKTSQTSADTFNCGQTQTLKYRSGAGTTSFGGVYYVNSDTTIFATFDAQSKAEEDFACISLSRIYFTDNTSYTITPYNIDEYGYAGMIFLSATQKTRTLSLLVNKRTRGLDADEAPTATVSGPVGNLVSVSVSALEPSLFDGVSKGDYITITVDNDGKATNVETVYSPKRGHIYQKLADASFYSSAGEYMGLVKSINYDKKRMKLSFGSAEIADKNFDMNLLEPTVYVFENDTADLGSMRDLEIGDFVVMTTSYDRPSTIIIYKQ